jgi:hypothetical protein
LRQKPHLPRGGAGADGEHDAAASAAAALELSRNAALLHNNALELSSNAALLHNNAEFPASPPASSTGANTHHAAPTRNSCETVTAREIAHAAVSRRPPIPLDTSVAPYSHVHVRRERLGFVHRSRDPFSVAPCRTLAFRFANFHVRLSVTLQVLTSQCGCVGSRAALRLRVDASPGIIRRQWEQLQL